MPVTQFIYFLDWFIIKYKQTKSPESRRGGRVDDCTGLENRRAARYRGFESLPLRQFGNPLNIMLLTSGHFIKSCPQRGHTRKPRVARMVNTQQPTRNIQGRSDLNRNRNLPHAGNPRQSAWSVGKIFSVPVHPPPPNPCALQCIVLNSILWRV